MTGQTRTPGIVTTSGASLTLTIDHDAGEVGSAVG